LTANMIGSPSFRALQGEAHQQRDEEHLQDARAGEGAEERRG
jgi:hypothetical protein